MSHRERIVVVINHSKIEFEPSFQTGRSIKERACIPMDHALCMEQRRNGDEHDSCGCDDRGHKGELVVIADDETIKLESGQQFWSVALSRHGVTVMINGKEFAFADPHQSGKTLKDRADIPNTDVLFLERPGEDQVVTDDAKIVLRCGDSFHSSPPANYGSTGAVKAVDVGFEQFQALKQPDGWTFLLVPHFPLPDGFLPRTTQLLIKLPPQFPDAAPDMFWVSPHLRVESGNGAPQGTSMEVLLGAEWQRFSWHLQPGAWRAGTSTLRDYMRCVRARFEKRN